MINNNLNLKIEDIIKLSDREEAYYQLVGIFIKGPEQVREQIRNDWDYGVDWIYPNQRRLSCSKNEKRSSKERIIASLVYDAIENFRQEDFKDKLVAISVIYHSCIEAGFNPKDEFEFVASIASEKVARFLRDFLLRKKEDKSLEAFMLTTVKNLDGETEIFPSWMN
jgi:hypothetical protein